MDIVWFLLGVCFFRRLRFLYSIIGLLASRGVIVNEIMALTSVVALLLAVYLALALLIPERFS